MIAIIDRRTLSTRFACLTSSRRLSATPAEPMISVDRYGQKCEIGTQPIEEQVAKRVDVGLALLHLGAVRFPVTGPVRYSMTARDAVALCRAVNPMTVIPVRCEGWSHFSQGRAAVEGELRTAPADVQEKVRWLDPGRPTEIVV